MVIDIRKLNPGQLRDLIRRAERRQREIRHEKATELRARLVALAKAEGFTIDELFGPRQRRTRRPAAPKYRNPADPAQIWSGRGKRPRWFSAALRAGKTEKDLRV